MPQLNINSSKFADLVACYILDKILNPSDISPTNKRFTALINEIKAKGIRTPLLTYFLKLNATQRFDYRRIRPALTDETKDPSTLVIKTKTKIKKPKKTTDQAIKDIVSLVKNLKLKG